MQQQILEQNPSPGLRVYTVWFNMLPDDDRTGWDRAGLTDPRVEHLWDEQKLVGNWFAANVTQFPGTEWDSYVLYGPRARWESEPAPLVSSGGTVVGKLGQLQSSIRPLLH